MTVLLVLLCLSVLLVIDAILSHRRAAAVRPAPAAGTLTAPAAEPVFVAGFDLPGNLRYHRCHTWARPVGGDTVAVGMDDFARRLTGSADSVRLPRVGDWVEQGAPAATLGARNRVADLVSPVAGEVVEVNPALRREPRLATDDPYGRGWLYKVRASHLPAQFRNLLDGPLARRWTEDERDQLDLRLMALSGSVLQDGGEPAPDFAEHLDPAAWRALHATFLLGETTR